ncbi:MAG: hypothetical protein JWP87_112 [Labilithrix sp.]|nr:hypothetical protein [Labilithrix sp.]
MPMTRISSALVLAGALAMPAVAFAQGSSNQAAAEALFDEGKKLMAAGQLPQACAKLAESQRLDPGAGTLLNLAACYERDGRTATAWATYKETIASADKSGRKEWAAAATKRVKALEPLLSKLTVAVPEAAKTSGLVIKRDGAVINAAEWGLAIPLDPGKHAIEASAPDKKTFATTVELGTKADAQTVTVPALESGAVAAPAAVPPSSATRGASTPTEPPPSTPGGDGAASSPGSTTRIVGLVLVGAGVVGVGLGAVFGLKAGSLNDDAKANCNADQSRCNTAGLGQVDDAKSAATISTIGFVAGAALIAGGAVLFFTSPRGEKPAARRTTVTPILGSTSGLSLQGAF